MGPLDDSIFFFFSIAKSMYWNRSQFVHTWTWAPNIADQRAHGVHIFGRSAIVENSQFDTHSTHLIRTEIITKVTQGQIIVHFSAHFRFNIYYCFRSLINDNYELWLVWWNAIYTTHSYQTSARLQINFIDWQYRLVVSHEPCTHTTQWWFDNSNKYAKKKENR